MNKQTNKQRNTHSSQYIHRNKTKTEKQRAATAITTTTTAKLL